MGYIYWPRVSIWGGDFSVDTVFLYVGVKLKKRTSLSRLREDSAQPED